MKPPKRLLALLKDARYFQILFLSSFLTYGLWVLGWDAYWINYAAIFGTSLSVQWIGYKWLKLPFFSWQSALITGLGLSLLCHANSPWTLALAAAIAIGSKFLVRLKGKHIFNPANVGIVAAILLTGDAWVSPGQWGQDVVLLFLFGAAGLMMLLKVGRIDTSLTFLLVFGGCLLARDVIYKGWPLDFWLHSLSNGSLALFAFFMITDPVTTPNSPKARILWAACIALGSFGLLSWFKVFDAPLWALVASAPLTAWLDRVFPHRQFTWRRQDTAVASPSNRDWVHAESTVPPLP